MKHEHTFTGVTVYANAVSDELPEDDPHALIFRWNQQEWVHWPITTAVGGLCVVDLPQIMVLVMGVDGEITVIKAPPNAIETVDSTDDGPSYEVPLRSMRRIGEEVYVAGMARRVYRRAVNGIWSPIDEGVFVPRTNRSEAIGFNAIDGVARGPLFVVGYRGEIWKYEENTWEEEQSTTDVALTCVRCHGSQVYAGGLCGTLLRRDQDGWNTVDSGATDQDFWGITVFNEDIYASTQQGLFVLRDDKLQPVELPSHLSTRYVDANDGILCSLGEKDLAWTEDGKKWIEVPLPG